jgi:4'-phosphopantetheinyl transferase
LKVRVFYARAAALEDRLEEALRLATPARRSKAARFRHRADQLRSLAAGLLLRRHLDVREDSDLTESPLGRLELSRAGPSFSLSHSGKFSGLALCAAGPCGLDIEPLDRKVKARLLANRVFSARERALLGDGEPDPELFFSVWTRKESLLKATGLGLLRAPESFSVAPLEAAALPALGSLWSFRTFVLESHVFSVAAPAAPDGSPVECEARETLPEELLGS